MAMQKPFVTIVGNLTRDPELRYTASGIASSTFSIAVNTRKKTPSGAWEDGTPEFFDVICWRDLAEHVVDSLPKGTRVVVVGELSQRSWETQEGEKRSKTEVVASEVSPSLLWATATVTRVPKTENGWNAPSTTPAAAPASEPYYSEEPF